MKANTTNSTKIDAILNELAELTPLTEQQTIILYDFVIWCANNHNHAAILDSNSYFLKHALQDRNLVCCKGKRIDACFLLGYDFPMFYVHNFQFKIAMYNCGVKIRPSSVNKAYWEFAGGFREVIA